MPWVRIDDHFDEHPKLLKVGPLAWGVWLAGLAYCNRNLTDGFIPWAKARQLASFEVIDGGDVVWRLARTSGHAGEDIDADWVVGLLVDAGLWTITDGGYEVHDYADFQRPKDEVLAERDANRKRQARFRGKDDRNGPCHAVTNGPVTPAPVPVPVPVSQNQSTAQTPPEVVKVKAIPRDDPLSPDERHAMTTAGLVIKAIERLELGQNGDRFQPGQWWGHSRKEKRRVVPMLATLEQLRRRLEAKDRPASPWAYCEATYEEKRASYWADHAEREQAARKKEPAAPIVAELLGGMRGG